MPGSPLIEAEHKIILRDETTFEDIGEVTRFTQWQHTLKLNDVSSWQLDMRTQDFNSYDIDVTTGIQLWRDDVLLIDGPISPKGIKQTLSAGVETTTIIGGCDNQYLTSRICYPVVTGPLFDVTTQNWKFGVLRSAVGISCNITKGDLGGQEYDIPLVVDDSESFEGGNTVTWVQANGTATSNWNQLVGRTGNPPIAAAYGSGPITISGVDLSTNTITLAVHQQYPAVLSPAIPTGGKLYQTSGGIVDDPAYLGYDTRTGPGDNVAKELVYFNAGVGACSDHFGTRAIPHLVVAHPLSQGAVVTSNARGESLLTQVQNVCLSGNVNFKTTQQGYDLVFETYVGNDLSQDGNLVFSLASGNLSDYQYNYGSPTANMVWGCGPETGVDKLMLPSGDIQSINDYGRWETWISSATAKAGDSAALIAANMVQTNNAALAQSIVNTQLTLTIQETDQVRYPRDFGLGDKVCVMIGDQPVYEIVTAFQYSIPTSATGAGAGTALAAALSKQETQAMKIAKSQQAQLRTMDFA